MFRSPPQRVHVVYSIHDPDLPICADTEEYQKTLDPSHLCNVEKLTPIELHNLTVAQRLDLRGRISEIVLTAGIDPVADADTEARARYMRQHWKIAGLKVRAALRRVGDVDVQAEPLADGYAPENALELLGGSPDVVEEIAGYVDDIAHLNPRAGQDGGEAPSGGASQE